MLIKVYQKSHLLRKLPFSNYSAKIYFLSKFKNNALTICFSICSLVLESYSEIHRGISKITQIEILQKSHLLRKLQFSNHSPNIQFVRKFKNNAFTFCFNICSFLLESNSEIHRGISEITLIKIL